MRRRPRYTGGVGKVSIILLIRSWEASAGRVSWASRVLTRISRFATLLTAKRGCSALEAPGIP